MKIKAATKLGNLANFSQMLSQMSLGRRINSITALCMLISIAVTAEGYSAERSENDVRSKVTGWLKNHPVMGTRARTISKVQIYPDAKTPGAVSVVSLAPQGTVVVNRDTRLPMIVMFTADTTLTGMGQFQEGVIHSANILKTLGPNEDYVGVKSYTNDDVYVPAMLSTSWGQWAPFNLYMPFNPNTNCRAVTGCGTIGMAQILNYYQWPPYGTGALTHNDQLGVFRPSFSTNFEHTYRWDLMRNRYEDNGSGSPAIAVGQIVYDIAVLGGIDCENNVSGIHLDYAGNNFANYMFYEKENVMIGDAEGRHTIEVNLLKGIPVPADIQINNKGEGHVIVFDGLLVNNGSTSYHTNFGWSGQNNLWWDKDAILAVWDTKPGIKPALIPLPPISELIIKQGSPLKLPWKIATQRQNDAIQLNLFQEVMKKGTWEEDCESLPAAIDTRSWSLDYVGMSGSSWRANSPYPTDYLTIVDEFIPTINSTIEFQEKHVCGDNYVDVEASSNGGAFQTIFSFGREINYTWQSRSVSLSKFSSETIKLRLAYHAPPHSSYYSNEQGGGLWIDNMRVTNTTVKDWVLLDSISIGDNQTIKGHDVISRHPKLSNLPVGDYNLSASLTDANNIQHRAGTSFTLRITKSGGDPDKFEVLNDGKVKKSGTFVNIGNLKTKKIIICNTGNTTIYGLQIKTTGLGQKNFMATIGKTTLAPGEKTILEIQFKPSKTGLRKMTIKISTGKNFSFHLNVIGRGEQSDLKSNS